MEMGALLSPTLQSVEVRVVAEAFLLTCTYGQEYYSHALPLAFSVIWCSSFLWLGGFVYLAVRS